MTATDSCHLQARPFKGILFDLDGTLIDAFKPICYALNKTLIEFGLEPMSDKDIQRHTGRGECSMISLFGGHREQAAQRFLEFHDEKLFDIEPMPYAFELLQALHGAGVPMAIVTSKSQVRADQQLEHLGWHHLFSTIIGLTPERKQKPDPHTILLACEEMELEPENVLMIGDGTADMKAAVRAQASAVGLTHAFSADELSEAGALAAFSHLQDIHHWLSHA